MSRSATLFIFSLALLIWLLAYLALRSRKRTRDNTTSDAGADVRPSVGLTYLDGAASIALTVLNQSDSRVWIEEIEFSLTELVATEQATNASCNETLKIRQVVPAFDLVEVSLVEIIYKAAGEPQLRYSCILSSIVRFRIGEDWYERPMQPCRLKMAGLRVFSNRRERWTKSAYDQARH